MARGKFQKKPTFRLAPILIVLIAIALGILLVSTAFRLWSSWQFQNKGKIGHH